MPKKNANGYSVSIPKLPFNNKAYTPILITLLVVAAFFLGSLYTKVQYLQKGAATGTAPANPQAVAPGQPTAPPPGTKVNVSEGNLPILGNKNAKVTVIEFADFRCPFCEKLFTDTESQLIEDYVNTGKVQFVFRNYAFLGPASTVAANAAECANEQGKFWAMHDYFYKNQPPESDTSMYTVDNLTQIAGTLGMNTDQFKSCLSTNKYQKNIDQDFSDGQKAGVSGTPSTFIDGQLTVGAQPYANFKTLIDAELAKNK